MQTSSLAITLSSVAAMQIIIWKCVETVAILTNQTDVDETYSLTWPPDTRESPSNVTLKTKKIVKRQAAGQDDTSDSSVAATAEPHQQNVDALGAARQPRLQQQTAPKGQCNLRGGADYTGPRRIKNIHTAITGKHAEIFSTKIFQGL